MAETIEITRRQLLELSRGSQQLDAIRESEKDLVPLLFDHKVAYRLMRNSTVVEREVAIFNKLDRDAAKACGFYENMVVNDENARKADEYQRKRAELLDETVKLEGIFLIKIEELLNRPEEFKKSKRNPVPQSVLARLAPIIAEGDEE